MKKPDWKKSVYAKHQQYDKDLWTRIRYAVAERDNMRCRACFKRKMWKNLTTHHIIPRDCGGTDDLENLITLCIECHDIIEETDIRTAAEINGYCLPERKAERKQEQNLSRQDEEILARIDANRPEWHARVYGGCK